MGSPFPLVANGVRVVLGGHTVLDGVDLAWDGRSRLAVLGPNGAGKTVLLRTLHGLIDPVAGAVRWNGAPPRREDHAMVFQRPVMLRRSALANVEYALAVRHVPRALRRGRARDALGALGLAHLAQRPARVMSGGEQQRVAIARAWATQAPVLFLDEPTASLDPNAAADVERAMQEMHRAGTAVLFTTHHLGLARRAADEIVFLHAGRIAERTPADRFFAGPRSREAEDFLKGELP